MEWKAAASAVATAFLVAAFLGGCGDSPPKPSAAQECLYDYSFHGLTLLLHFGGKPGATDEETKHNQDVYDKFVTTLKGWRKSHNLMQFPVHATLLYGINSSQSSEEDIKAYLNQALPSGPAKAGFAAPIDFTVPKNVDNYSHYMSGPGWEYGDSCCDLASMRMRFAEIHLQPQASDSALQVLHAQVAKEFPSGGSSTLSGFVPHISTVYANSDSHSDRCVTQAIIPDLWQTLDAKHLGLEDLDKILWVTSIGLWDMQDKTTSEWKMLAEWRLNHTTGGEAASIFKATVSV